MAVFSKGPGETLDYSVDWGSADLDPDDRWLPDDDTVIESGWTITGPDDNLHRASSSADAKTTRIWLAGGTPDATYKVVNSVVSAQGRAPVRGFEVYVREQPD